ncbi:MAG TPA: hypothetical protein GXZ36_06545 [Firmicutes bacterium]|nr:hypothetical protein [Bacillota bacterium]
MKKTMLLCIICLILILSTGAGAFAARGDKIPTRVEVIAQSCMAEGLCLTVVDLDNNEIVVLFYYRAPSGLIRGDLKLSNVIRTGMFVDPDEQGIIDGQDAPVTEEDDNDLTKQKNLGDNFSY